MPSTSSPTPALMTSTMRDMRATFGAAEIV